MPDILDELHDLLGDAAPKHLTDLGNAERLVARHGQDIRHNDRLGGWLTWDGRRWARNQYHERIVPLAIETVHSIYDDARTLRNAGEQAKAKRLAQWAWKSESRSRIEAMLELAKAGHGIPVAPDAFDSDPWLLNCANGTLDLRTGQLREHRRGDMISRLADVDFEPHAGAPTWDAFLHRTMGGDTEMIRFLQCIAGYALTGSTREEVLFLLHGPTASGKTKFLEGLRAVLGDYAAQTSFTSFLATRQNESARNDLARLAGVRLVTAVESDDGARLAEAVVKQLTGGDTVAARFLYHEFFEFRPEFKLVLATNHRPVVRGTDNAIWRRIKLVPFPNSLPEVDRDRGLLDKLYAERPGILAWAVRGCQEWQANGLQVPARVQEETEAYRTEQDALGRFIEECCLLGDSARVQATALYDAYREWAGRDAESQRRFGAAMSARFRRVRLGNGSIWYQGIGLQGAGTIAP